MKFFNPLIAIAVLTAAGLSACSEEPQVLTQTGQEAAAQDQQAAAEQRRERTLRQGESYRIY